MNSSILYLKSQFFFGWNWLFKGKGFPKIIEWILQYPAKGDLWEMESFKIRLQSFQSFFYKYCKFKSFRFFKKMSPFHKAAFIKDVINFSGFLTPPPPIVIKRLFLRNPPLKRRLFSAYPPPVKKKKLTHFSPDICTKFSMYTKVFYTNCDF